MHNHPKKKKSKIRNNQKLFIDYIKYSGIIFQAVLTIFAGAFAGYLADGLLRMTYPVFIILFSFSAFVLALYYLYKSLFK